MSDVQIINIPIGKMDKIFPTVKNVDKSKLQITNVGLYSVSKISGSLKLVYLIKKYFKTNKLTITDGTANVGSDSIMLALHFNKVNSIEYDKTEFKVLQNNVKQYNLDNIDLYNDDTTKKLKDLIQDVIFIDAPWGGVDYKDSKNIKLFMSNKEISDIFNENKNYAKLFIFKVPVNYDFNYFISNTKIIKFYVHSFDKNGVVKYYFIFVPVG